MPDKAKQDSSAPDTPRIVEQLTALLERQATPHDSFRLPLAVPTYEGHTDKKSVADFLQELQDYRDAQALTNETLLLRVLPVALSGSAARWRRRQSFEMQEAQAGTLRYASSVEVEATTGASAQADHVLAAGETTGAGDDERMPIVGQHSTAPRGPLTLRRSWKTYCGSSVGYGSSSRAARRVAEAPTPGVLVVTSSCRQEAQPRETFDKAMHAQRDKAASLSARTTTRETTNQRPRKVLPAR
ncbi:hypothetical protein MTO96_033497 [Rhipicephalus appendiculatus]